MFIEWNLGRGPQLEHGLRLSKKTGPSPRGSPSSSQ